MPFEEFGGRTNYSTNPDLPHHLEHKPVYAIPYEKFDGIYQGGTDARYLSVGISQWSEEDLSLKIMRHTGTQWTRQAEELPLHRVIDATIFLAKVLLDEENSTIEFERNLFLNQASGIRITKESISDEQQENYNVYLDEHIDLLKARFKSLYLLLDMLNKKEHL